MRSFIELKNEISTAKNKLSALEKKAKNSKYISDSDGLGVGVRSIIFSFLAVVTLVTFHTLRDSNLSSVGILSLVLLLCVSVGLFLLLVSLIEVLLYYTRAVSVGNAAFFTIWSALVAAGSAYMFLVVLAGDGVPWWPPHFYAELTQKIEAAPQTTGFAMKLMFAIWFVHSALMLIGSIIKWIVFGAKKLSCNKKVKSLTREAQQQQEKLVELEAELEASEKEAHALFDAAIKKEEPDVVAVQKLSTLGWKKATQWLKQQENKRQLAEGKRIYEEEIGKEHPDLSRMSQAADLGDVKACLYYGKYLIDDQEPLTEDETEKALLRAQPFFKMAAAAGDPDGKLYYLYTVERTEAMYDNEWKDMLKEFRELKKSGKLSEKAQDICEDCIVRIVNVIDKIKRDREASYQSSHYEDNSSRNSDRLLSESEVYEYFVHKLLRLWNPSVVNNDPSLTPRQKEQINNYARIYGD